MANYFNKRLFFVGLMGFASTLPLVLTSSTLQAWLTQAEIPLMTIGLLSLLAFPYNLKFLWAPFLDRYKLPFTTRRKGWMMLMQLLLAVGFFVLGNLNPHTSMNSLMMVTFLIIFASATQDIVVDAYRADILPAEERGLGSAVTIFYARIAIFVAGSLALIFANYWGWPLTFDLMSLLLLLSMVLTLFAPEKSQTILQHKTSFFIVPFLDLLKREKIVWILLFVVLYKAGAALAVALTTNFLLKGLHFSLLEIGIASKGAIIAGMITGAFVGGILLSRFNLYVCLLWFGLAQAFSILTFAMLASVGKVFGLMVASLFIENFCSGMSTAAFLALLMSLCHSEFSATQFALLSAIDSIPRFVAGPLAASIVLQYGWVVLFALAFVLCFPALGILSFIRNNVVIYEKIPANT